MTLRPALFLLLAFSVSLRAAEPLSTSSCRYAADGRSSGCVHCPAGREASPAIKGPFGSTVSIRIIAREFDEQGEHLFFRSTGAPGDVWFEGPGGSKLDLTFYKIGIDIDEDGFPDAAELDAEEDRCAFREWFVRVAESQFMKRNASWNVAERDCAGLIRYSYREALKAHDNAWLSRSGLVLDKNIPDIRKFHYPDVPVLGENIFRTRAGQADDPGCFSAFADAETLARFNTGFVSRSLNDAKKGDILFFRIESKGKVQFHSMIVAGPYGGSVMLIYHTGTNDVIKRVDAGYLRGSGAFDPDPRNGRFLGVFRFSILE